MSALSRSSNLTSSGKPAAWKELSQLYDEIRKRSMVDYKFKGALWGIVQNNDRGNILQRCYNLMTIDRVDGMRASALCNSGFSSSHLFYQLQESCFCLEKEPLERVIAKRETAVQEGLEKGSYWLDAASLEEAKNYLKALRAPHPTKSLIEAAHIALIEACLEERFFVSDEVTKVTRDQLKGILSEIRNILMQLELFGLVFPLLTYAGDEATFKREWTANLLLYQQKWLEQDEAHRPYLTRMLANWQKHHIPADHPFVRFCEIYFALSDSIVDLDSLDHAIETPSQDQLPPQEAFAHLCHACEWILLKLERYKEYFSERELSALAKTRKRKEIETDQERLRVFFSKIKTLTKQLSQTTSPSLFHVIALYRLISGSLLPLNKFEFISFNLDFDIKRCIDHTLFHCLKIFSSHLKIDLKGIEKGVKDFCNNVYPSYFKQINGLSEVPREGEIDFAVLTLSKIMERRPYGNYFSPERCAEESDLTTDPHFLPHAVGFFNTLWSTSAYWINEHWLSLTQQYELLEEMEKRKLRDAEISKRSLTTNEDYFALLRAAQLLNESARANWNLLFTSINEACDVYLKENEATADASLLQSWGEKVGKVAKVAKERAPLVAIEAAAAPSPSSDDDVEESLSEVEQRDSLFVALSTPSTEPPSIMADFYTACDALKNVNLEILLLHSEEVAKRPFGVDKVYMELDLARRSLESVLDAFAGDEPRTHNLEVLARRLLNSERVPANVRNTLYQLLPLFTLLGQANEAIHYSSTSHIQHKQLRNFLRALLHQSKTGNIEDLKGTYVHLLQNIQQGLLKLMQAAAAPKEEPLIKGIERSPPLALLPTEISPKRLSPEATEGASAAQNVVFEKIGSMDQAKAYIERLRVWIGVRQQTLLTTGSDASKRKSHRNKQLENAALYLHRLKESLENPSPGFVDGTVGRLDLVDRLIRSLLKGALFEHEGHITEQYDSRYLADHLSKYVDMMPLPAPFKKAHKVTQYPAQNRNEKAGELASTVEKLIQLAPIERMRMAAPTEDTYIVKGAPVDRKKHEQLIHLFISTINSKYVFQGLAFAGHLMQTAFIIPNAEI